MAGRGGRRPGAGRKKGIPNRMTIVAREAFNQAFQGIGGVPRLVEWANESPEEFFKLYARLIPVDVTSNGKELAALTWTFGERKVSF